MNLIKIQEELKNLPMQAIMAYANGQNPQVPPYVALGELNRRKQLEQSAQQVQPEGMSVKEQLEKQAGLMTLQGQRMQQAQNAQQMQSRQQPLPTSKSTPQPSAQGTPEDAGVAALPGGAFAFREGGIVGFAGGGEPKGKKLTPEEIALLIKSMAAKQAEPQADAPAPSVPTQPSAPMQPKPAQAKPAGGIASIPAAGGWQAAAANALNQPAEVFDQNKEIEMLRQRQAAFGLDKPAGQEELSRLAGIQAMYDAQKAKRAQQQATEQMLAFTRPTGVADGRTANTMAMNNYTATGLNAEKAADAADLKFAMDMNAYKAAIEKLQRAEATGDEKSIVEAKNEVAKRNADLQKSKMQLASHMGGAEISAKAATDAARINSDARVAAAEMRAGAGSGAKGQLTPAVLAKLREAADKQAAAEFSKPLQAMELRKKFPSKDAYADHLYQRKIADAEGGVDYAAPAAAAPTTMPGFKAERLK